MKIIKELSILRGLSYEQIMEIAKNKKLLNFLYDEGTRVSNDISYLSDDISIFCDLICTYIDGKVLFECYYNIFNYVRNMMVSMSNNPLKTAQMITIIG